ncbi:MAG: hypothetical protein E7218_08190 [Anaerofustis stercorihominis]|nr:hypothetical protein [Anaerofustis stercorihominis]
MRAFRKGISRYLIYGMTMFHYLTFLMFCEFVDRMDLGKNMEWLVLIVVILMMVLIIDIRLYREGFYMKTFMKLKVDEKSIRCYGFMVPKYEFLWDEIKCYGISTKRFLEPLVFLSLTSKRHKDPFMVIDKNNVVFTIYDEIWAEISQYMPEDMQYRINNAIELGADRVWKK